jgi:hypothetical protein
MASLIVFLIILIIVGIILIHSGSFQIKTGSFRKLIQSLIMGFTGTVVAFLSIIISTFLIFRGGGLHHASGLLWIIMKIFYVGLPLTNGIFWFILMWKKAPESSIPWRSMLFSLGCIVVIPLIAAIGTMLFVLGSQIITGILNHMHFFLIVGLIVFVISGLIVFIKRFSKPEQSFSNDLPDREGTGKKLWEQAGSDEDFLKDTISSDQSIEPYPAEFPEKISPFARGMNITLLTAGIASFLFGIGAFILIKHWAHSDSGGGWINMSGAVEATLLWILQAIISLLCLVFCLILTTIFSASRSASLVGKTVNPFLFAILSVIFNLLIDVVIVIVLMFSSGLF